MHQRAEFIVQRDRVSAFAGQKLRDGILSARMRHVAIYKLTLALGASPERARCFGRPSRQPFVHFAIHSDRSLLTQEFFSIENLAVQNHHPNLLKIAHVVYRVFIQDKQIGVGAGFYLTYFRPPKDCAEVTG